MEFTWQRREYEKETGVWFPGDICFLKHLFYIHRSCYKIAEILYCSHMTITNMLRDHVKLVKGNTNKRGSFLTKLKNSGLTNDDMSKMNINEISLILDHPPNTTGPMLRYHGIKYKSLKKGKPKLHATELKKRVVMYGGSY